MDFGAIRSLGDKRVFADDAVELIVRTNDDADGSAHQLLKCSGNGLGDLRGGKLCVDDSIATLDVGFDLLKTKCGEGFAKLCHGELAVSAEVYGAKKNDIRGHPDTASLPSFCILHGSRLWRGLRI